MKSFFYRIALILSVMMICRIGFAMASEEHSPGTGVFAGQVIDSETGEPVGFVYLLIEEIHFWQRVGSDGVFRFENIPAGIHAVKTYRLGYKEAVEQVAIVEGKVTNKTFRLALAPILIGEVIVSAHRVHGDSTLENPDIVVADRKLRQNLGMTIAKTLENEPGLDKICMGPAPARPVLRGLAGDRLLLLEDGERTGDLSATSADHAVSIDPMTTERIEVIRGPEAMIYGSNVMAGVINVQRESIPRVRPEKITGSVTYHGESVTNGSAGALELRAPVGPMAMRWDASVRSAGTVQTPVGPLQNTEIQTLNSSIGLSLVRSWGHAGVAGGWYDSEYGIPPDPIAGHPSGVDIDMLRQHVATEGLFNVPSSMIRHVYVKHQYSRYQHQEIEASGIIGMEFGVVTHHATAILHFCECGPLYNARIGIWGESRDYASGGLTFTPDTRESAVAVYLYDELIRGRWSFNGAIRADGKTVRPEASYVTPHVGHIRTRDFAGISGAVSGHYHVKPDLMLGASVIRTFRAPGVEELFSEGPHLAAYSYEVGNADLDEETGIGFELFGEYESGHGKIRAAVFRNELQNYIFPRNTGERSWRRADLFQYQYSGFHALMTGYEVSLDWAPANWLSFSAQVQYVKGQLLEEDQPIPRMPPLSGKVEMRYHRGPLSIIVDSKGADRQNRLDQFELPTEGYLIQDTTVQYLLPKGKLLHTLSLTLENIGNAEYRRHLNRVKEIMPEPGRNVRLLYKVFF
ncbi:MAG: TonB-dependent receptor [Candidatus Zhuqueibacterota bacterium]